MSIRQKAAVIVIMTAVIFYMYLMCSPYPEIKAFCQHTTSTVILDRDGEVVQIAGVEGGATQGLRREWVPLVEMPPFVANAFIQAEDKHFYHHIGIDPAAIVRAAYLDARYKRVVSGASTITMQLARIIRNEATTLSDTPPPRRTLLVKVREAVDALRLEARLSKDRILELYLNNVPFGHNVEGVASAARTFFSVPLEEVTPAQCKVLCTIPRRPSLYDVNNGTPYTYPFNMPHYVRYLQSPAGQAMLGGDVIGRTPVIRLSASLMLQHMAERLLADEVSHHSTSRITQGALLALDTRTGEVLSWVGSCDFNSVRAAGQVDGVTALERPGSAMKPFLYALALEKGYSPTTVLPDVPLEAGGDEVYVPQNFNNRYNGPIRFRIALASSLNVPAVYLLRELGMEQYRECLHRLGFASLDGRGNLGLSLALGGAEVSLMEMTRAFSVFPRDGVLLPLTAVPPDIPRSSVIADTERAKQSALSTNHYPLTTVFSPDTARLICSILSDASARAMGFGYAKTLTTPFPSIFKTGTANQYMSIVAFAATPHYTVGVWMGNFDGNTVQGITGSAIPARVARQMLITLHEGERETPFAEPAAWEKCRVCALSGLAATPLCPDIVTDYARQAAPLAPCTWHTPEGVHYPPEYAEYLAFRRAHTATLVAGNDDEGGNGLVILSPMNGSVFFIDPTVPTERQTVTLRAAGGGGLWRVVVDEEEMDLGEDEYISVPLQLNRGQHTCTVRRGNEARTVSWMVK